MKKFPWYHWGSFLKKKKIKKKKVIVVTCIVENTWAVAGNDRWSSFGHSLFWLKLIYGKGRTSPLLYMNPSCKRRSNFQHIITKETRTRRIAYNKLLFFILTKMRHQITINHNKIPLFITYCTENDVLVTIFLSRANPRLYHHIFRLRWLL